MPLTLHFSPFVEQCKVKRNFLQSSVLASRFKETLRDLPPPFNTKIQATRRLGGNTRFSAPLKIAVFSMNSWEIGSLGACFCLNGKKRWLVRAILWEFLKIPSHEISFSSDGILKTSDGILKMSDKIACACEDCRFFLPKSLIGDNEVDCCFPRIKKTRTIFRSLV